ncbi:MAG: hypothetical protein ABI614_13105, partial [Planctomycetota bacterium]
MSLTSRHATDSAARLLDGLRDALLCRKSIGAQGSVRTLFQATDLPKSLWGCAATLYQPTTPRIMVVRATQPMAFENVRAALNQLMKHDRFDEFAIHDWNRCRLQIDFIVNEPDAIELATLSDSALPEIQGRISGLKSKQGTDRQGFSSEAQQAVCDGYSEIGAPWQVQMVSTWPEPKRLTRFELGVDGLRIVKDRKRRYFLPGDAFVHSILGIGQLRRHIQRLFPGDDIEQLTYYRFRSLSFVSGVEPGSWVPLYRGLPPVPEVNDASLLQAARAGSKWIADSLQPDGRFVYYYDAATDKGRDHEHPTRDPVTDPYYNLLRHGGGIITMLLDEQLRLIQGRDIIGHRRHVIESAIEFLIEQLVTYRTDDGQQAAYALYNRKAKLGGSGIGLYVLALYQHLYRDARYAGPAKLLANHLINELNDQGEFRYYHIYLDKPVGWAENQRYFSFYYPGEAILGLSHFSQHVCQSDVERQHVFDKLHRALRFLLRERPHLHKEHFQTLPADSWLMMGINDLWDIAEFQQDEYKQFVFDDADQMVRLMYTEEDALYPDYVG